MKSDSKRHYDNFEFFPLYCAGFRQLFSFLSLVEKLTVSLRLLQCGYSFLPAKEIPGSLSGFIHNFFCGKDVTSGLMSLLLLFLYSHLLLCS
jgi:hypothetical protein